MDSEMLKEMVREVKPTGEAAVLAWTENAYGPFGGFYWLDAHDAGEARSYIRDGDVANAVLAELVRRMRPGVQVLRVGDGTFQIIDSNGDCWASNAHREPLDALWEAFDHDPERFPMTV